VEDIQLQVPITTPTTTSGKKKNKQKGSTPSSFSEASDVPDRSLNSDADNNKNQNRGPKDLKGDGMILDRVVEGGLDGVEGMSPSRKSAIYHAEDGLG
jgi:hypothetical protein